jgi:hypothetical protein
MMTDMDIIEIKAYVPARDFALSKLWRIGQNIAKRE